MLTFASLVVAPGLNTYMQGPSWPRFPGVRTHIHEQTDLERYSHVRWESSRAMADAGVSVTRWLRWRRLKKMFMQAAVALANGAKTGRAKIVATHRDQKVGKARPIASALPVTGALHLQVTLCKQWISRNAKQSGLQSFFQFFTMQCAFNYVHQINRSKQATIKLCTKIRQIW